MPTTDKQDDGTTSDELNPMPDLARQSDAEYGTGRLAKEAADYGKALDEIQKEVTKVSRYEGPLLVDSCIVMIENIRVQLRAVGKMATEFDRTHFEELIDKVRSAYYGSESERDVRWMFLQLKSIIKGVGK